MLLSDFEFELPPSLIASYPLPNRSASRLFAPQFPSPHRHQQVKDLATLLQPNDLLVFNDTRVIPARLYGEKATGGKVELLLERLLSEHDALVQMKASKSPKIGSTLQFAEQYQAEVIGREDEFYHISFGPTQRALDVFLAIGHMPLPPYMARSDEPADQQRYQTVYAKQVGAVAAPTAGLHFDEPLLQQLREFGVEFAYVTLHVGAGTFQPVRVANIHDHKMHSEFFEVSATTCAQIKAAQARGGRVIAVGTTSVRTLESLMRLHGQLIPCNGMTDIFIYPGYQFQVVDALITNFHLSGSTLLMLVSAFVGREFILSAYQEAINEQYRFFSYGDAMFLQNSQSKQAML